jgi:ABC-2 type transport system ATP-binding protein
MDEAEHCHRLAFIQRGEIIAYGTPEHIKAERMHGGVLEIEPSDPIKAVKELREVQTSHQLPLEEVELYGSLVHVIAPEMEKHQPAIVEVLKQADIDPGQMSIIEPSLEDVFIASMRGFEQTKN